MLKYAFILCLLISAASVAQANTENSMRDLATQSMFDYGKKLYDRHDYKEAILVFKRILRYDPQNQGAAAHVHRMDPNAPMIISKPSKITTTSYKTIIEKTSVTKQVPHHQHAAVTTAVPHQEQATIYSQNSDIQKAIDAQDKALSELKEEIHHLQSENNT